MKKDGNKTKRQIDFSSVTECDSSERLGIVEFDGFLLNHFFVLLSSELGSERFLK